MSQSRINVELSDPLIDAHGLQYSKDELVDFFRGQNINNIQEEASPAVGVSLHNLYTLKGGIERIITGLMSDTKNGIEGTAADIAQRQAKYGKNVPLKRAIRTICDMIIECFDDTIMRILCVAAVFSMGIGIYKDGWSHGWIDGTSIIIAVCIIVIVTVANNWVKEKQFQELQSKSDVMTARVVRNGQEKTVDSSELVVGDIVEIPTGDTVPADCIVITADDFTTNEANLTGEPEPIRKEPCTGETYPHNPNPFLLQTTLVETGTCKAVVVAVGINTFVGRTGLTMNIEKDMTPLQKKLETIAEQIGKAGLYCAILTFIAMMIRLLCKIFLAHSRQLDDYQNLIDVLDAFIIGLTVVVVAVPEGLPLAVTISLAFSVGAMAKEHNLVKKLHASETMGNAQEICTDKTGTLTQNRMTVMEAYLEDSIVASQRNPALKGSAIAELVGEGIVFNSTATIEQKDDGSKETIGNVTECGLLNYLVDAGFDVEEKLKERRNDIDFLFSIPFSSKRKRATTVVKHPSQEGKVRVYCKGAPEIVIKYCDYLLGAGGESESLSEEKKNQIVGETVKGFATKTYRTLLISYCDYDEAEWEQLKGQANDFQSLTDKENVESGLTVIGIFALVDPLRPGIPQSVRQCHKSGINVRMVTGDNIDTAIAISKQANIITDEDLADSENQQYVCMTGEQFREEIGGEVRVTEDGKVEAVIRNTHSFKTIAKKLKVLARSLPDDKFMLVHGLIENCGKTVAVTGDGTNDAPALNRADVGFAMGIAGTDVAKSASDIVLTNDDFCSIEIAIKYGRNIFDNVRKFLQFQLTVNVAALIVVFLGSVIFEDPPLTSVQMLWVNLIMDTFAALALATEPPNDALMDRQPMSKTAKIVNATMWRNIIGQGIYQLIILMTMLIFGAKLFGFEFAANDPFYYNQEDIDKLIQEDPANAETYQAMLFKATEKCELYTMVFQTFVFMQLFNQINARKLGDREFNVFHKFCNNAWFICLTIFCFAVQWAMVQYGGRPLRATPLKHYEQAICFGIGSFSLIWGVIIKLILPSSLFECLSIDEKEMDDKEEAQGFVAGVRKSFRQSTNARFTESKKSRQ